MHCPLCDEAEMLPGRIIVKKDLSGFLLFGFGWSELHWEDTDKRQTLLLQNEDFFLAYRCPSCEGLVADPKGTREAREHAYASGESREHPRLPFEDGAT